MKKRISTSDLALYSSLLVVETVFVMILLMVGLSVIGIICTALNGFMVLAGFLSISDELRGRTH